jgi:hypothetical protein
LAEKSRSNPVNFKNYVLDKVAIKLMEDNIPDDDQPDKSFDYIVSTVNDLDIKHILDWAMHDGFNYVMRNAHSRLNLNEDRFRELAIDYILE